MFKVKYRYLYILALSVYSYLNLRLTVGDMLFDFEIGEVTLFLTLTVSILVIWELNRWVEHHLDQLHEKTGRKVHPLLILFVLSILNVVLSGVLIMEVLYPVVGMPMQINLDHFGLLIAFGFRVNLFLNCVNAIVYFNSKLKQSELDAAAFKQQSVEARFEALRNQVNPHFLFNSFNTLSSLVHKDADTAASFIDQLSTVYRYLLTNQDNRLVPLSQELDFLNAYLYLLRIRFGDNLEISQDIKQDADARFLPPAALQILIENAIKHNVISQKKRLRIDLFSENGSIVVRNNLQEKNIKESSTHIGLKNIMGRYQFLSNNPVRIDKSDSHFTVKLPLIQIHQ